jgi:hypothetical protein
VVVYVSFFLLLANIGLNSCPGRKIFPAAALRRQSNTTASRKRFKEQRAALELEEEAWAAFLFGWLLLTLAVLPGGHPRFFNLFF